MSTPFNDIHDEQILDLISSGQTIEKGFRLLVEKYQERMYWQVRRLVHEHEDANDILQNCFIKVYRNIQNFERKSKLYTWLYRIVTNESLTFLQKQKQLLASSLEEEVPGVANQLKADPYFDGNEVQVRLQEAISQLPEKQRIVFTLRYFDEMSYADMSEVLDTSEGALKASFHHAVKKIESYVKSVE